MRLLLAIISILGITCAQAKVPAVNTVEKVDINRYMGVWYEIGSIPQRFSQGCHCTRADYNLKNNGKVDVFNSCNKKSVEGKLSEAHGTAKVVDKQTNAKLKVSFFWPFYGAYWIIGLADDYRYAVISNPEASTLWILSRTPQMASQDLNDALAIAANNGVDLSKLRYTEQNGCVYP